MSDKETLKLLSASENVHLPTGYAVVMDNLLQRLNAKGWEIHHMAWQHHGRDYEYVYPSGPYKGSKIVQLAAGRPNSNMYSPTFPEYLPGTLKQLKPNVMFSLIDIWFTPGMVGYTNEAGVPYVNYFPVDGDPFFRQWLETVKNSHTPLAMSKYGRDVVHDCVKAHGRGGWKHHCELDVLYHGVDTSIFRPMKDTERQSLKQEYFPKNPDTFCVGVVGKNADRKQHPRVIEAFAQFAKGKKDVALMMKVGDPSNAELLGHDIYDAANHYGVEDKVVLLDDRNDMVSGVTVDRLAAFYGMFDVLASSTSGEGFGLTTLEAMACGTPVVITDYTTSAELVGEKEERGWLPPIVAKPLGDWNVGRGLVDTDKMAACFQEAYDNPSEVKKRGDAGFRFAKTMDWDIIAEQLNGILRKAANEPGQVFRGD